jgi:serine/threonine-protein kinase
VPEPSPLPHASLLAQLDTLTDEALARAVGGSHATSLDLAATVEERPRSTIEPAERASSEARGRAVLADLGARRDERGIGANLEMGRTIGEGGMGIVRLATQRSLGRSVAVKTLRPDVRDARAALRLLREAWVTGTLEHPNIVPVYDLGVDEQGSPVIVLKRIEGVEWALVMRDAEAARARYGVADLLEHNLRILVQLSNAVSLAHARGVLHRDLKPENVMIGEFGEVYLVDWGIAVSLEPDPLGRLPHAADQSEMAGTPCYMAPEMLGSVGGLGVHTDVYLLGAVLHEVLTGAPPHAGTFKEVVGSILRSTFTYGADVPPELAAIAARAMSREPADRFPSAEEFRLRIEWYLRHRGSLAVSAEASRRLEDMEALVAGASPADAVREALYQCFAECRFGFKQAAIASPDNDAARRGLLQAVALVVRFELRRGAPEAAAAALAEMEAPDPTLTASVDEALRARAADSEERVRLEALRADLDPRVGRPTRVFVTGILGFVWTLAPQASEVTYRRGGPHWHGYAWTVGMLAMAALLVLWGRESLTKTVINRRTVATGALMFASQLALQVGAHVLRLPDEATQTLLLLLWATVLAAVAVMVDARFWFGVVTFFLGFGAACRWPERRFDVMSVTNLVLLVNFLAAWWRPREDRERRRAARRR